jgi:hypothetical protein
MMLVIFGGCATAGSQQKVEVLRVDIPLQEPVWVPEKEVVLALSEDRRRVVRINVNGANPGDRAAIRSVEFEDVGKNLALNPEGPELAYLARPKSGRISALSTDSLRVMDSYDVGDSPTYVTLDVQSGVLFALSKDGSTVSRVEIETPEEIPAAQVGGDARPSKAIRSACWRAIWRSWRPGVLARGSSALRATSYTYSRPRGTSWSRCGGRP